MKLRELQEARFTRALGQPGYISILIFENTNHPDYGKKELNWPRVNGHFQQFMDDTWAFKLERRNDDDGDQNGLIAHIDLGEFSGNPKRTEHDLEDDFFSINEHFDGRLAFKRFNDADY